MNRVKHLKERVTVLRGLSVEMAAQIPDNSLGLVYLDAGHDYDSVMADLNAYYPKLVKGGIMAGHDYLNTAYGVKQAVTDFAAKHGFEVHLIPEHKDEDAGFLFKV
jgi:cephalosporin hydroxylase